MTDFLSPKCVEHEVNDQLLSFYPIRLATAFQIKEVLRPLANGVATILSDRTGDKGYTTTHDKQNGFEQTIVQPLTVEMAAHRSAEKQAAILDLLETITGKKPIEAVARLIMDSLREEFPHRFEAKDVSNFVDKLDSSTLAQLLVGVAKANSSIFGPFGQKIGKIMGMISDRLEMQVNLLDLGEEDQPSKIQTTGEESASLSTSSSIEDTD